MGQGKTFVELNGKRYDTRTGRVLDIVAPKSAAVAKKPLHIRKAKPSTGKHVDGFVRAHASKVAVAAPKPAPKPAAPAPVAVKTEEPKPKKQVDRNVKHLRRRSPQKAKTLMRTAVKKPNKTPVQAIASPVQSSPYLSFLSEPANIITARVASERATRAIKTQKSALISRFGELEQAIIKKSEQINVRVAPSSQSFKPIPQNVPVTQPAKKPAVAQSAAPARPQKPSTHNAAKPQHAKPAPSKKADELFAKALESATSHQHKPAPKPKARQRLAHSLGMSTRSVSLSAAALSVLLLAGFFAYQNVPNFAMRLAASKAGFAASMPGYHPAGFTMDGPIAYGPGHITLNFKSTTDERYYKITQRPSNWNSETLLDQYVAAERRSYQTYQNQGKTVYIYDGANATWVDGGVWFHIEASDSLNSDQLLKVASSL